VSSAGRGWWLYGVRLDSAVPLPGLPECDEAAPNRRIAVAFVGQPPRERSGATHFATPPRGDDSLEIRSVGDGAYELWFGDGTWARIAARGDAIDLYTPASSSFEDSLSYLYGVLVGFALRLRNVLALHASVVMLGDRAAMFVGASGAGKSMLAAAFALRGHAVVTEDVAALSVDQHGVIVHRGHADVRLWPSAAALFRTPPLKEATPAWPKLVLPTTLADGDAVIGGIFLLRDRDAGQSEPSTTPLSKGDALVGLLPHTYVSHLLPREVRPRELAALGALVRMVPVHSLTVPALPEGFEALHEALGMTTAA
jgi:hypothetical protein